MKQNEQLARILKRPIVSFKNRSAINNGFCVRLSVLCPLLYRIALGEFVALYYTPYYEKKKA